MLVSLVIFPLFFGYIVQVLRGEDPASPVRWSWQTFVDGIKIGLSVCVLYILLSLFVNLATIRFAREQRFFAAFSFGEICRCIDRIGFWQYVAAVILVSTFVNAVIALCMLIPVEGVAFVLALLVTIPLGIFQAR